MDFQGQNYSQLLAACLDDGALFEDPFFPPTNKSIGLK